MPSVSVMKLHDFYSAFFNSEPMFYISGHIHRYNVRMEPGETTFIKHLHNSPMWKHGDECVAHDSVVGPLSFTEPTVTSHNCLDMLDMQSFNRIMAPPYCRTIICACSNAHFPGRWIGRGGCKPLPSQYPDFTPLEATSNKWCTVSPSMMWSMWSNKLDTILGCNHFRCFKSWVTRTGAPDVYRARNNAHTELHWVQKWNYMNFSFKYCFICSF
jgi:hypothetical protein